MIKSAPRCTLSFMQWLMYSCHFVFTSVLTRHSGREKNKAEQLEQNPNGKKNPKGKKKLNGVLGKGPQGDTVVKSHAMPAAKEKKDEQQLVVAHAAKEKKDEQQLVVARDKEKKVEHQLVGCPAEVQAEVKMSYERYMQIGYKELERLTLENYSLSGSAALASLANLFSPKFLVHDAWKLFL